MTLRWPSSGSSEKMWACPRSREKSVRKKCRNGSYDNDIPTGRLVDDAVPVLNRDLNSSTGVWKGRELEVLHEAAGWDVIWGEFILLDVLSRTSRKWGFSISPQTNWLMVEDDDASQPVPAIFNESKCYCKNVIVAISAFFPRAFFPTPWACSHLFAGSAGRSTQRHNVYLHVTHNVYICYVS